jgi:predicted ATP-dependent endonuclease of OLD family
MKVKKEVRFLLVEISNFGPIKRFDFDLTKNLIVTYGKNNIGKSYAMQIVYLLLKNFNNAIFKPIYFFDYIEYSDKKQIQETEQISSIRDEILKSGEKEIDISEFIKNLIIRRIQSLLGKNIENSFVNTFGDLTFLKNKNNSKIPSIVIEFSTIKIEIQISEKVIIKDFELGLEIHGKKSQSGRAIKTIGNKVFLYANNNSEQFTEAVSKIVEKKFREFFTAVRDNIPEVYYLPASRSGIYIGLSSFSPIMAELSKSRALLTKKIELPGISETISDYYLKLTEINPKVVKNDDISLLANDIERDILKGEITFDNTKKTLLYKPLNTDLKLEMNAVSSMVSEISPIVAFFKYILNRTSAKGRYVNSDINPIIFIEEPEAHLHPEIQVKLIEIFNKLVERGVRLVITSHSNYIFNKLNNLVLAKKLNVSKYSPIILTHERNGSISKTLDIDEFGVNDENFTDISEELFNERENIIELMNNGVEINDKPNQE